MRVLVLSWDTGGTDGSPRPQAAGLATALAAAGDDVRLVTRLGEDGTPPVLPGVEVHAVADAPPIVPEELDDPLLAALAFATRATSVAVRRLEERDVDVVHAEGWQAGPVVAALRTTHDVPVLAALGAPDVTGDHEDTVAATGRQLARDATGVCCRSRHDRDALAVAGATATVLPPGADQARRRPGAPPAAGPLHLVAPPGRSHRRVAAEVRDAGRLGRPVTRSWRRRPFAVAVLDPHDLTSATRALALGVPLLAVEGPVGELARDTGAGEVVAPTGAAVAAAVARLAARPDRAAALGDAGAAAAVEHTWAAVADAWRGLAATVVRGRSPGGPDRLHAAD